MANVPEKKNKSKSYIPYGSPAWLAYPQDWMSDYARRLLAVLLQLADRKTGQLRIPKKEHTRTRGWITTAQLLKRARMRRLYFYSALEELELLSFAKRKYGRAMYSKHDRLWQGRGQTEYSIDWPTLKNFNAGAASSKVPENAKTRTANTNAPSSKVPDAKIKTGAASSTVYDAQVVETEPQDWRSSKVPDNGRRARQPEYRYPSKVPTGTDSSKVPTGTLKDSQTTPSDPRAVFAAFLGNSFLERSLSPSPPPKPPAKIREGVGLGDGQKKTSALESTEPELTQEERQQLFGGLRHTLDEQQRKEELAEEQRCQQRRQREQELRERWRRQKEALWQRGLLPTENVTSGTVEIRLP